MATVLLHGCGCGAVYAVYLPKATIVSLIGERAEFSLGDAIADDLREEAVGAASASE